EVAGVALNRGAGEVGNLGVGDAGGATDVVGKVAEAGTENDADVGSEIRRRADVVAGGLGVAEHFGHRSSCSVWALGRGFYRGSPPHCLAINYFDSVTCGANLPVKYSGQRSSVQNIALKRLSSASRLE